jgi:glyoxylase-like metal-dependent hydrolase (beta-lactamase superfamily II)
MDGEYVFDRSDPEPTGLVAAADDDLEPNLVELGTGVFALVRSQVGFGESNIGMVIDADGISVIDTGSTPVRGKTARTTIEALTSELDAPLRRAIITSSRVTQTGGSALFWRAGFYGTAVASEELDQPVNLNALRRLLPQLAPAFHDEFETRPITHTVDEPAWLTPSIRLLPTAGEAPANLVAHLPGVDTIFLGALGSFGVRPLAFAGDPARWAAELRALADRATTFVPGHGTVGGRGDMAMLADYLDACVAADGNRLASGPWEGWTNPEFDAINVERAARLGRGDRSVPTSMLSLLGLG